MATVFHPQTQGLILAIFCGVVLTFRSFRQQIDMSHAESAVYTDGAAYLSVSPKLAPMFAQHGVAFLGLAAEEGMNTTREDAHIMRTVSRRHLHPISVAVSAQAHDAYLGICGGFFVHDTYEDAEKWAQGSRRRLESFVPPKPFGGAKDELRAARAMIKSINSQSIIQVITDLSAFQNRNAVGEHGVKASLWIANKWKEAVKGIEWASVRQFDTAYAHAKTHQSIEATFSGKNPDKIIIVGAHFDSSITKSMRNHIKADETSRQPGADDDASGTACVTHIIGAFAALNVQPSITVKFHAYGAEELGLHGSKAAANAQKKKPGETVVAYFNLDMVGWDGGKPDLLAWISDYTDTKLTDYVTSLSKHYMPDITHKRTECGYACGDHASWNAIGVPTVYGFEAVWRNKQYQNRNIHSAKDTVDTINGELAANFARVAAVFVAHVGLDGIDIADGEAPTGNVPSTDEPSRPGTAPGASEPAQPSSAPSASVPNSSGPEESATSTYWPYWAILVAVFVMFAIVAVIGSRASKAQAPPERAARATKRSKRRHVRSTSARHSKQHSSRRRRK